jgi:DNA-binding transcriptional ArsR family regulator
MRFDTPLEDALGTGSRVRVLRTLAEARPEENLTGREVARRARISHPQAARTLRGLAHVGLVTERRFGTYALYEFNGGHVLAEPVRALFEAEAAVGEQLLAFLAAGVARCRDVRAAVLVDDPGDDVEIAVLTAPGRDFDVMADLEPLGRRLSRRFGGHLDVTVIERRRALELIRSGDPSWRRIADRGIPVYRTIPRVR